jgi:hypothetical protein
MAKATDQYGTNFEVSGYRWTSSNESVAVVSQTGKVTVFLAGPTVTIGATPTEGAAPEQKPATITVNPSTPTLHTASITTAETWRAAENPHVVRGSIEVNGATAPLITLEAGAVVLFDQDAELRFTNGSLQAQGTQETPIYMLANQVSPPKGYWRGVVFATEGSASGMNHVTLSDCGNGSGRGACIGLEKQAAPVLLDVTVRNSGTVGLLVADDGSAFGTGSARLNVSGSTGYAVSIGANQASTLPTGGTFTNNSPNAVELKGHVVRSQTWPNPGAGIPYAISHELHVKDTSRPTLTISEGTDLRFGRDSGLFVGFNDAPGDLILDGKAAAPVRLTADSAEPGSWKGVFLGGRSSPLSRLTHATIEFAGAPFESTQLGSLNILGEGSDSVRPFIENVTVQKGGWTGVFLGAGGSFTPGSNGLISRDNRGYAISVPPNQVPEIPTDSIFTGNTHNAVEVTGGTVRSSQTWPNFGIPYVIAFTTYVRSVFNPTLTLLPGTELRFEKGTGLLIGGSDGTPGVLKAVGTAEAPIRFVPNAADPEPGQTWRGLSFWMAEGSKLDHVLISHGGIVGQQGMGNLNVYREIGPFVTNSTFSKSIVCGVTVSDGSQPGSTRVTTDFTLPAYNNTFVFDEGRAQCNN